MIVWIPIAVNETPVLRGKGVLPEYSAAVIGSSVVLRAYGGGWTGVELALTTVPFTTAKDAHAWVEANKTDLSYSSQLPAHPSPGDTPMV